MLNSIGLPTLILIIILALLLFGPNKLPELGRAVGRTLREFRKGAREIMNDEEADSSEPRKDTRSMESAEGKSDPRRLPE